MRRVPIFIIILLIAICTIANDGSYCVSGNTLKPLVETRISITKEILTITRNKKDNQKVDVSVYYEFNNPDEAKKLIVGFEAMSPSGDVNFEPIKGHHPYMTDFTVEMNDRVLPYKIHLASDSLYFTDGAFREMSDKEIAEEVYDQYSEGIYVYHFNADFKPGKNIIKHTYTCELSSSVIDNYSFDYVLTAAMRWGNRQIDDFTLIIDMGDDELLQIPQTFFDSSNDWLLVGLGKSTSSSRADEEVYYRSTKYSQFYTKRGKLIFQKKNFKTQGELYFYSPRIEMFCDSFDLNSDSILNPMNLIGNEYLEEAIKPADSLSRKVLRNLPFAIRGYIFKNNDLQTYFEKQVWYFPNQEYVTTEISGLSEREHNWVKAWSN